MASAACLAAPVSTQPTRARTRSGPLRVVTRAMMPRISTSRNINAATYSAAFGVQTPDCPEGMQRRRRYLSNTSRLVQQCALAGDTANMPNPESTVSEPLVDSKVIGMIVLIAGTTIGGGTLALPAAAAPPGFLPSAAALTFCWLFLFLEAVLLVEVSVRMQKEGSARAGEPVSFEQMAERTLGKVGGAITGLIYQFYSYASILAYVAAAGNVVSLLFQGYLSAVQGQVATVFGIWAIILSAGKKGIEHINEKANYVFFALLALIIVVGMGRVKPAVLVAHTQWQAAPAAAGILLFNVVFHDIIPLVCEALQYNIRKINFAFFMGGAIPLVCYLFWIAAALGTGAGAGGGAFVDPVNQIMMSGSVSGKVVQLWAFLAIATSFVGCGMAQAEYEESIIKQFAAPFLAKVKDTSSGLGRIKEAWEKGLLANISYAVVLLPPLAISLCFPDLFFKAADLAGVYGVAILYGVLPPLFAFVMRRKQASDNNSAELNCTPGGVVTLLALFSAGMAIAVRETLTYI